MASSKSSFSDIPFKKSKLAPLQEQKMIDRCRVRANGGEGGNGCTSFRRSRHDRHGKADGGSGGRGGDVILECSPTIWDLSSIQHHINAKRGGHGGSKNMIGTRGADKVSALLNPEETRLEFPKELNESQGQQAEYNFKGGAGGACGKQQSAKPTKKCVEPESPKHELDDLSDSQNDLKEKVEVTPARHSARTAGRRFKFSEASSGDESPENNIETSEEEKEIGEEIEKQKAHERYMKLQKQGKTEQANKDLERLALIRQQRAEAAKKRDEEKAAKEQKKPGKQKQERASCGSSVLIRRGFSPF